LPDLHIFVQMKFLYRYFHNDLPGYFMTNFLMTNAQTHAHNTRNRQKLTIPFLVGELMATPMHPQDSPKPTFFTSWRVLQHILDVNKKTKWPYYACAMIFKMAVIQYQQSKCVSWSPLRIASINMQIISLDQ
jgi:hypothetical protein